MLQERLEAGESSPLWSRVVGVQRREQGVGEGTQRVGLGHAQQQPVGAELFEPGVLPALEPAHLQRVARFARRPADVARCRRAPPAPRAELGIDAVAERLDEIGEVRSPLAGSSTLIPSACAEIRNAALAPRTMVGRRQREARRLGAIADRLDRDHEHLRVAREPEPREPRAASVAGSSPRASSSKKSPWRRRSASATARDFASSIANRLSAWPGDDPVQL